MSADLRQLMRDLADQAPVDGDRIALADRSYASGRRRRTIRRVRVTAVSSLVLVAALFAGLFAGSSPLASRYGTSSATHVSGYPHHIGQQLPVLDLPSKRGPIAGLLSNGGGWWAVSPNGHRWNLSGAGGTGGALPAVSADGRLIGYPNARGRYTIHDLVTGDFTDLTTLDSSQSSDNRLQQISLQAHGVFSADDRYLAMSGNSGDTIVIDVHSGKVTSIPRIGVEFVAGWVGDQVVTASGTDATLTSVVDGSARSVQLSLSAPLLDTDQDSYAVSPGGVLTLLSGGRSGVQMVTRVNLRTGAQLGSQEPVPSADEVCGFTAGRDVYYGHTDAATGAATVAGIDDAGTVTTRTTIDPALEPICGIWATEAFDGTARTSRRLDRLTGWLMSDWPWIAWPAGILGGLALLIWRVRASLRSSARDFPDRAAARQPWPRRAKVALVGAGLAVVALVVGLLIPFVFVPLSAGNLLPVQPAIWWTAVDQSAARPGDWQGDPASVVPFRLGEQQGFLVLVANPTGQDQQIQPTDPEELSLAVATTAGTSSQARSLVYRPSATIPAHQSRWVRQLIRSDLCWEKGGSTAVPAVTLQVRIGWVTRTEVLPLQPQMKLTATTTIAPPGANC
jgi:hypothetical protein